MSFSLYRCGDDTYVVVPQTLSPPIEVIRQYGNPTFVPVNPRHLLALEGWGRISSQVDGDLYAVISNDEMDALFEVG